MADINWSDLKSQITPHFTVHDALWLPSWQVHHIPSETEKVNILKIAEKMELVREHLNVPLVVHCWIRPIQVNCPGSMYDRKNYNIAVGGAPGSAHIDGLAVDFHPQRMTCSEARMLLMHELERMDIRMENIEGNWIHIDGRKPLPRQLRFFRP